MRRKKRKDRTPKQLALGCKSAKEAWKKGCLSEYLRIFETQFPRYWKGKENLK